MHALHDDSGTGSYAAKDCCQTERFEESGAKKHCNPSLCERRTGTGSLGLWIALTKPLPVQLAVSGSRTVINFDIINLDSYDLILGTPFLFQHKVLMGFHPSQVAVGSNKAAEDICKEANETPLPPLRDINHTIPLIDETKVYWWRPVHRTVEIHDWKQCDAMYC
ncbi:hypothetical protein K439DRAFT_1641768 [Ramaria rubella]|nr:hypothetical protein K439DRAFT_1641768 [Ramaria rubella]